ncbi:hypothetical protein FRC08_012402 [Ceratobasidium sp. 394]|nr:hypothetical protein FRC08_012402 [Ceratobasidium sp. 394]
MSHIYWDGNPENALRWPIDSLHGTVELDLFSLETGICPTSDEMVAILSNCPALQTLRLGDLEFIPGQPEEFPTIFLPSLKLLEIADVRGDGLPQLLSLISPGVLELDVRLDSLYIGNNRIASPTHLLLARSNVASLSIDACSPEQVGQYSLYLSVLPRLRTLFLGGLHAEEVMAALSDSTLQLPHLKSLCFFATVMFDGVVHSLERVIAARKLHRLVFVSCAFSRAFDRAEGNARVNHGKLCYSMPADMMEQLSEQVGKVVVHNEPWNELYQGMLVQELIRLD